MRSFIAILFVVALSINVFAEEELVFETGPIEPAVETTETQVTDPSLDETYARSGFRFAMVKSLLAMKGDVREQVIDDGIYGNDVTIVSEVDKNDTQEIGMAVGYSLIRPMDVGFDGEASYNVLGNNLSTGRIAANVTYGLLVPAYVFFGPSASRFLGDGYGAYETGLGAQVGSGYRFKNLDLRLSYVYSTYRLNDDNAGKLELTTEGVEFALGMVF